LARLVAVLADFNFPVSGKLAKSVLMVDLLTPNCLCGKIKMPPGLDAA
jgi:hypothetical protein